MSSDGASSPPARRRTGRGADRPHRCLSPSGEDAVRVKMEPDDDIKDYAETTMNELLGWYGYDKLDTRGLNLRNLNQFPPSSSSSSPSTTRHDDDISEDEMGRSHSPRIEPDANASGGGPITCAWCQKTGLKLFTLKTSTGETKAFCSEPCFNQCRRAAFKKSRVCDWCKHVRHTVNYVDFQDGDHQLQFCSDKCLNQYKMHIFCKETQAYLQMHPHLQDAANRAMGHAGSKLITPDLWLRDCQDANGGPAPLSDEERAPSAPANKQPNNGVELEDLSKPNKSSKTFPPEKDIEPRKSLEASPPLRDKRPVETCNTLASYLRAERDRTERRKRHHHDSERDHTRKRERISSTRSSSRPIEAPPAHLSSSPHSTPFAGGQNRVPYPPSLNGSPTSLNPPAAHSNALPSHQPVSAPSLPPGLPPPPPLLNNEFLPPQFSPPFFQPHLNLFPQQQQLEALLRMQSTIRQNAPQQIPPFPPNYSPESMLPHLRGLPPQPNLNQLGSPNTVMLPFPVILPLPIPIPVPIPLSSFSRKSETNGKESSSNKTENKEQNPEDSNYENRTKVTNSSNDEYKENCDDLNQSIVEVEDKLEEQNSCHSIALNCENIVLDKNSSSYSVTNKTTDTNRLILTRTKKRHTERQISAKKF